MKRIYIGTTCDECLLTNSDSFFKNQECAELCDIAERDGSFDCYLPFGIWLKIKIKLFMEWLQED